MEVPVHLRRMAVTPVSMPVASTVSLRQPLTSEGMWTRPEDFSVWGSPVHQKCSTTPRDGSGDPRPPFVDRSLPMVTTVESLHPDF